ncbi:MAG: DeoR family transcriptional regulator, partial [Phycisphaeraceae bacterium]|nr:DeoR family transcriptional regulator [Phycisphaeraceae bacterium]
MAHPSPRCTVTELQDGLKVSRATIRRDLIELEQQGIKLLPVSELISTAQR